MEYLDGIEEQAPREGILSALERFERLRQLTITIHDCRGTLCSADGEPFFPGRGVHRHEYCLRGRFENREWNRRCHECCMLGADGAARRSGRPFFHSCWKGVSEVVVPIRQDEGTVFILYAGVFRSEEIPPPPEISRSPEWETLHAALPVCPAVLREELAAELQLLGRGILGYLEKFTLRAGIPHHSRAELIRFFLSRHAHEEVSLRELAKFLHLSETHCCHQVKHHFGVSFQRLLLEERMRRSRNLLANSDKPLKQIAADVGLRNEFYFNRIFHRETGVPPGRFRADARRIAAVRPAAGIVKVPEEAAASPMFPQESR